MGLWSPFKLSKTVTWSQFSWQRIPHPWWSSCKELIAIRVQRASNNACHWIGWISRHGQTLDIRGKLIIICQIWWCLTVYALEDQDGNLEQYPLSHRQPVELLQVQRRAPVASCAAAFWINCKRHISPSTTPNSKIIMRYSTYSVYTVHLKQTQ